MKTRGFTGLRHSPETKLKMRLAALGVNNSMWKGDDVSYRGLHHYIERNMPIPEKCQKCRKIKKLEACNISGKYLRDFKDWEWLCRSCHMKSDGRMKNLRQYQ